MSPDAEDRRTTSARKSPSMVPRPSSQVIRDGQRGLEPTETESNGRIAKEGVMRARRFVAGTIMAIVLGVAGAASAKDACFELPGLSGGIGYALKSFSAPA